MFKSVIHFCFVGYILVSTDCTSAALKQCSVVKKWWKLTISLYEAVWLSVTWSLLIQVYLYFLVKYYEVCSPACYVFHCEIHSKLAFCNVCVSVMLWFIFCVIVVCFLQEWFSTVIITVPWLTSFDYPCKAFLQLLHNSTKCYISHYRIKFST